MTPNTMEQALGAAPERFRLLTELAPVGIFQADPAGRCLYANPLCGQIAGLPLAALLGDGWATNLHPDDREPVLRQWQAAVAHGSDFRCEHRYRHGDGTTVWALAHAVAVRDPAGVVTGYVGTLTDLTARQRAHDELERRVQERTAELLRANAVLQAEIARRQQAEQEGQASEVRYQALVHAVPDALFRIRRDGTYLEYKPGKDFETYRPPQEFLGRRIPEVLPPEQAAACQHLLDRALATGASQDYEYQLPMPGGPRHYETRVIPIGPDEVLAMVRDITARRQAEERLRQLQEELAHVARLSLMGEMASGLAHELNQPLTAIATYTAAATRFLRAGPGGGAEAGAALEAAAAQVHRAGQILDGIRHFVARGEPRRAYVSINELIEEVVRLDAHELRAHGVRVHLDLAAALPPVLADGIQIEQVLLNLVRNAREAMAATAPGGRDLYLRTRRTADGAIEVAVRDRGCGLPAEIGRHLFQAFRTTKPGGMGMGLAISRSLIEAHEGRLWAEPNPEGGTTFYFTLPTF